MRRGRPRAFNTQHALDAAMMLFWRHGYEGASVSMLAEAMDINAPSLYAAFGNKEALFRKALNRYIDEHAKYLRIALAQPTARDVAAEAFRGAINMVMKKGNPDGCLLVHGALAGSPECDVIRHELSARRASVEALVQQRFERARKEGDLPASVRPVQLARYLMTMIWGLSVQAAGGANPAKLKDVAAFAMQGWPTKR
jgi:AcrR family transcriptional regulator